MTLIDESEAAPVVDEAQLLFQEARDRRRRRWIVSGITAAVVVVLLVATLGIVLGSGGGGPARRSAPSTPVPAASTAPVSLNFRPVLCYAPALSLAAGQSASTGALPTCAPQSQLTAANLDVNTATAQAVSDPPPDARFSTYASTPSGNAGVEDTVLLSGTPGEGGTRYVLGPAVVTQKGIASATAVDEDGQWLVNLNLTPEGATQWDSLAQQQFHAIIGVVENGTVISAPIIQPSQTSFTSFDGQVQISGEFTRQQANALARGL